MSDAFSDKELDAQLLVFPEWHKVSQSGCTALKRQWQFDTFAAAWEFAGKVAELAETYQHHPLLSVEWGRVSVTWWSHDAGGITKRDIDMLSLCDHLRL